MKNFRQVFRLTDKDEKITALQASITELEMQVKRLTEKNAKLVDEKTTALSEKERLDKTWKMNYTILIERVGKADEAARAREETIKIMRTSLDSCLDFLRKIDSRSLRLERGGRDLLLRASALSARLEQIGEVKEQEQ